MLSLTGRWVFGITSAMVLAVAIFLRMEILAVAALASLALAVLPTVFESLIERLRKLGPAEFDPLVKRALETVPKDKLPTAEREVREREARMEAARSWAQLINLIKAELAALGVRVTALEEELAALRAHLVKIARNGGA